MTDKQLDVLEDICTKGIAANIHVHYYTEMIDLITALRAERAAHQATQAELEAARNVVYCARIAKAKHGFADIEEAINTYDTIAISAYDAIRDWGSDE